MDSPPQRGVLSPDVCAYSPNQYFYVSARFESSKKYYLHCSRRRLRLRCPVAVAVAAHGSVTVIFTITDTFTVAVAVTVNDAVNVTVSVTDEVNVTVADFAAVTFMVAVTAASDAVTVIVGAAVTVTVSVASMVIQVLPTCSLNLRDVGMQFRIYIPVVLGNLLLVSNTTVVDLKKGRPFPRIVGARWYLFMSYPEALRTIQLGLHMWMWVTFGDYMVGCLSGFFSLAWEIRSYFIHSGCLFLRITLLVSYGEVYNNISSSRSAIQKHTIHRGGYPLSNHLNLSLALFVAFPQSPLPILKRVRIWHELMDHIITSLFRVLYPELNCFTLCVRNIHPCDRNRHPRDCNRLTRIRNKHPRDYNRYPRVRNSHPPDPRLVTSVMVFHRGLFFITFISFACSSRLILPSSPMVFNLWITFCRKINSGFQLKSVLSFHLNLFPVTLVKTLHSFCVTDGLCGDLDAENSTLVEFGLTLRRWFFIHSDGILLQQIKYCHLSPLGLSPGLFDSLNGILTINSQAAYLELMDDSRTSSSRVLCLDFGFTLLHQIPCLVTKPLACHNFTYWLTMGHLDMQTYKVNWMVLFAWKNFGRGVWMLLIIAIYISIVFLLAFSILGSTSGYFLMLGLVSFFCTSSCVLFQLVKSEGLTWISIKTEKIWQDEEDVWFQYDGVIPFSLKGYVTSGHFYKWPVAVNFVCTATPKGSGFVIIRRASSWFRSNLLSMTNLLTPMVTRSITISRDVDLMLSSLFLGNIISILVITHVMFQC